MIHELSTDTGRGSLPRTAWLEVDTSALADNVRVVRGLVGPRVRIAAVVKADGYGHGLVGAGRAFLDGGADLLCVAGLEEALVLRHSGISAPLYVLFAIPPAFVGEAAAARIQLTAGDRELLSETLARWREARAGQDGEDRLPQLRLHLEVDTGLTRAGVKPGETAETARQILETPGTVLEGLCTHLATPEDAQISAGQEDRLREASAALESAGISIPPLHIAATGGLFAGTCGYHDLVRPGLCLYGELPEDLPISEMAREAANALQPAMRLACRPIRVAEVSTGTPVGYGGRWRADRPSTIATLPIGYGDGFVRGYQPGGEALVRGRRVPLVGTVAMDAVAADVTDVPGVGPSDEFVLLGAQGGERITAHELARRRTTIAWEVLTSIAYRLPRVYHAGPVAMDTRTLATDF